ncbi:MAG: RnfABCDGE type electron transport complex subunit D [Burkholderiales bacterium]|nr:RnfABCDGE type electron transport complex subunit D [Phycisphaerae bacterium]
MRVWRFERNHLSDLRLLSGMLLPILAGVAIFGWRALGVLGLVIAGAHVARYFLNRLRTWNATLGGLTLSTRAALVTMFLPATLFDVDQTAFTRSAAWPLAIGIGIVLAILSWALGRWGTVRFSPVVITALLAMIVVGGLGANARVLQRDHVFRGDLFDARFANRSPSTAEPWLSAPPLRSTVVLLTNPAAEQLEDFLDRRYAADRRPMTIPRLIGDNLPPMEDLVIGGHPAPIGCASVLAIIVGGLLLVYRRMAAFRVPALMVLATLATLLIAPVPVLISPEETAYRWLGGQDPRVGWAAGITFANYLLIASPVLLVTLFLACQPSIRPHSLRASCVYALLFGIAAGLSILLVSVGCGPLVALMAVQFVAPTLQRRLG